MADEKSGETIGILWNFYGDSQGFNQQEWGYYWEIPSGKLTVCYRKSPF